MTSPYNQISSLVSDWLAARMLRSYWLSSELAWLCPPQLSLSATMRRNSKLSFLAEIFCFAAITVSNYRLVHARPGFLDSETQQTNRTII